MIWFPTMLKFVDRAPLLSTRLTRDGYLVADVKAARTGIQQYAGWEVGKPEIPVVNVYRSADQVFTTDSMGSYAHKPVTNDHPDEEVTADNWRDVAVGQVGDEIKRDGDFIRVPLIVMDAKAIKQVQDGKRELSAGYTCELEFIDGVTPEGVAYQAIQKDIRINHVAIVDKGRAGPQARIGDKSWGHSPLPEFNDERTKQMDLRKILVDGLQVETTEAGAAAIDKLTSDKNGLKEQVAALTKTVSDNQKTFDTELAKKDGEIETLKGKVMDVNALDAAAAARGDLIAKAKSVLSDIATAGLTDVAIRRAVVVAKCGDSMKDKSDDYITARFDMLCEDSGGTEELRNTFTHLQTGDNGGRKVVDDAQAAYVARFHKKSA